MSYEISRELLSMFDGTNDAQIFIAINGNVYDVTPRKDFYWKEENFLVGVAKMSQGCLHSTHLTSKTTNQLAAQKVQLKKI
jgi:predicted heme/steroid binding protein